MSTLPTNLAAKLKTLGAEAVQPEDTLRVYKSHLPYCKYAFGNGSEAEFIKGVFYTKKADQIEELDTLIAKGHPVFYIDPNETEIVAEDRDPMVKMRKQIRAEILAEGFVKTNPDNDMGKSAQGPLNAASSRDIASVSAGGNGASGDQMAKLVAGLAAANSAGKPAAGA
jgi:hypothetical protein